MAKKSLIAIKIAFFGFVFLSRTGNNFKKSYVKKYNKYIILGDNAVNTIEQELFQSTTEKVLRS